MLNIVIVFVILAILSGASVYVVKAKKRGRKCIGCPAGGCCSAKDGGCGCGGKF